MSNTNTKYERAKKAGRIGIFTFILVGVIMSGFTGYVGYESVNPVSNANAAVTDTKWTYSGHTDITWDVAHDPINNRVYSGAGDNTLTAHYASNGSEIWSESFSYPISNVDIHEDTGNIYAGKSTGTLYKFDKDGNQVWTHSFSQGPDDITVWDSQDYIYYGGYSGLFVRDASNNPIWSNTSYPDNVNGVGIDESTQTVIIAVGSGVVHAYDATTGNYKWATDSGKFATHAATVYDAGDLAFVGMSDGLIKAYQISDGSVAWTYDTNQSNAIYSVGVDESSGTVYAGNGSQGEVIALDASNGDYLFSYTDHSNRINEFGFDESTNTIFTVSDDQTVKAWQGEISTVTISGTVKDSQGQGIDNASVELYDVNSDTVYNTTTDDLGQYSLDVAPGTNYSAFYSKRGYKQETQYVEPSQSTTYDVTLTQATPVLYGYVYDNATGSTLPDVNITAWYKDENGISQYVDTQTDITGYYEIQLEADEYNVTVTEENYVTEYNNSWYIDENTQKDWYIDPQGNNLVSGYVKDSNGNGIEDATVEIGENYSTETDAQGYYEILVTDGTYNVTASKQGYIAETKLDQTINSDATFDFTLNKSGQLKVQGYVTNDKGDDLDNAVVYFENDTQIVDTATTDSNGYYSTTLAEGWYDITATKNLYENSSTYTYIELDPETRNFTLRAKREIDLEAADVIWQNSTANYTVTLVVPAYSETEDVTDQATVTSSNTTILNVDSTNHVLESYAYKGNVTVNATYNNYDDNLTVIVANQTAENVALFKDWGQMTAAIWGNPVDPNTGEAPGGEQLTMAMLFIALIVGIALSSWASAFAGIGGITVTVVFGWMMGWVGDGMVLVTLFTGLFIGLNLAANVNYEMRN